MSDKEILRRKIASVVLKKAWKLYKKGSRWVYSFRKCLKVAWQIIKGKMYIRHTKVVGVTFDNYDGVNRQKILKRLSEIPMNQISIQLEREEDNPYDSSAIKVIAVVSNKGSAVIGYLKKGILGGKTNEVDFSGSTFAIFQGITGIGYDNLGCNISFVILDK